MTFSNQNLTLNIRIAGLGAPENYLLLLTFFFFLIQVSHIELRALTVQRKILYNGAKQVATD